MAVATFDTLKFANTLKAAGVPDKQAEAEASVIGEALSVNFKELVNKDDLKATKEDLQRDLREAEQRLSARIEDIEIEARRMEQCLLVKIEGARVEALESEPNLTNKLDAPQSRLEAKIDDAFGKLYQQMKTVRWMMFIIMVLVYAIFFRMLWVDMR